MAGLSKLNVPKPSSPPAYITVAFILYFTNFKSESRFKLKLNKLKYKIQSQMDYETIINLDAKNWWVQMAYHAKRIS